MSLKSVESFQVTHHY